MRATNGSTGNPTGAVGYIGSAPSSYWFEDFYWAVGAFPIQGNNNGYVPSYDETTWGAFDAPFMSNYVTQDAMNFVGNLAVTEVHIQGYPSHSSPLYYWQAYNLLGDPSLVIYMTQGEVNSVSFQGLLPIGANNFTVSAEPGSYVGISMDGVLHGAALVDESGSVDVPIIPFTTAGTADIVVTKPQYQPVMETVVVATPAVVIIDPISIPINTITDVTISVYEEDGTTPIPNVNIEVSGLGVFGTLEGVTNLSGNCTLNFGNEYGGNGIIHLIGWREGDSYNLFEETMDVTGGADLTNTDIWITTTFGLSDTFGLNMPGTVHFTQEETDCDYSLYVVDADTFITESVYDSISYTPSTLTDIYAYIMKTEYNLYTEQFTTIEVFGTVSGFVTDSEYNNPVSDAKVRFYESGADPTTDPLFSATTNASGFYNVTDEYPVDYYDIHIDKWGFDPYEEYNYFLAYGANTHNIVIEPPEPPANVSGHVYNTNESPLPSGTITFYRYDTGDEYASVYVSGLGGSYPNITLPLFTYNVCVTSHGYMPYNGTITITGDMTIDFYLGIAALFDNCENGLAQWISDIWDTTEVDYVSPTHSFTDSPDGDYPSNATSVLLLADPIDMSSAESAVIYFNTKWDIENNYDYGQVLASIDGTSWTPLEGEYTNLGTGSFQPNGEPLYDGTQSEWVYETSDLSAFVGEEEVYLKFLLRSDGGVEKDGWYIDDILVGDPNSSYEEPVTSVGKDQLSYHFALYQNYPNPMKTYTTIRFSIPKNIKKVELKIYNIKGQKIKIFSNIQINKSPNQQIIWNGKDDSGKPVANGIYFYKLTAGEKNITKKMLILR
jgi:hypothetical protein